MSKSPIPKETPLKPVLPKNASIKIIGLGGIGSIVSRYLSTFLAAQRQNCKLTFIDGDDFEPKNAARMLFKDFGNKAEVVAADLEEYFEGSKLTIITVPEYVRKDNVKELIQEDDIIILCVDNHATRKLINTYCGKMDNITLISGGNDGIEEKENGRNLRGTYGNCQVYARRDGKDCGPSLTTYHPEIDNPADKLPSDISCTDLIMSVPQILFVNLAAASCILNTVWLYLCKTLHYAEISFDVADGAMNPWPTPAPELPDSLLKKEKTKVLEAMAE